MGKTLMGSTQHKGNISMLTPEQQQLFSQALGQLGPDFLSTFSSFLQPQGPGDYQDVFQQSFVDPAMQALQTQIAPAIQQRFVDANAGSSSALNQALAQSATDLSTSLGSQFGQFMQGQQGLQQQALGQFMPLLGQQTFSPMIQKREGILGPLIGAAGALGAGALMRPGAAPVAPSSKEIKENIRDYTKSLDVLEMVTVKQYDYIEAVGGHKDKVGIIAEDLPKELTAMKDGVLHVDLYGLISVLINSMKNIDKRLKAIEEVV